MISILLTLLLASGVEAPSWTLQLPPDPRIIALEVKLSSGEFATVTREVRTFLEANPDHPGALHLLGRATFLAGKSIESA
ncbi:MAG TPA: hypothetical protein EYN79_01305, partial [Planctomycetes bacterium]|nr:hypothetical protein [Planctomycetota bacterium]